MSYYAVRIGKIPGVYRTWEECRENVSGFSGSIYKKFSSLEEALHFQENRKDRKDQENRENRSLSEKSRSLRVYTDGGFRNGRGSWAFVTEESTEKFGEVLEDKVTNNVSELTAIRRVLEEYSGDLEIVTDSKYSIGVLTKRYKATTNLDLINKIIKLMSGRTVVLSHVKAHCGNQRNERCDFLCTQVLDSF